MKKSMMLVAALCLALTAGANAQIAQKKTLTLEGAKRVVAAAVAEAHRDNAGGAIAVVDEGGNLICVERLDNTFAAGANISIGKARTAALFKRPTKFFEDVIKNGRTSMVALQDFTPLQGGVPITVGGEIVGAIGVSGANSAQQDEEIAMAGAAAAATFSADMGMTAPAGAVTYFDNAKVADAFKDGSVLYNAGAYQINASRRDAPGKAEVHAVETDIFYVTDGSATLVTGGNVVEPMASEPNEVRGSAINGGETRRLAKGDVVVIPNGVPHWFKDVQKPLTYYTVKVRSNAGGVQ